MVTGRPEIDAMLANLSDAAKERRCECVVRRHHYAVLYAVLEGDALPVGLIRELHDHHRGWCQAGDRASAPRSKRGTS